MGKVKTEVNVTARNDLGRFIKRIEMAGEHTVRDLVDQGAAHSRRNAPVGSRPDHRSIPIKESIYSTMRSRTSGSWGASARHAIFQEKGARPHPIIGNPTMMFWWESAGRWWVPGLYGEIDYINHPGNPPQPFLEPALSAMMKRWRQIAKKHYPHKGF